MDDQESDKSLEKSKVARCEHGHYLYEPEVLCEVCRANAATERSVSAQEAFTRDCIVRTASLKDAASEHRAYVERQEAKAIERHEDWKKIATEQTQAIQAQTAAFERIAVALEKVR